MRKLTLVLLFIGFQLQLLAQESTEPQPLNRFYGGIEPHISPTGNYVFGGVRFGKDRHWSYETALGTRLLNKGYWYNMNQFAVVIKHKKGRFQQFYLGEYVYYASAKNRNPSNLKFKEYYKKDLLDFAPIVAPLSFALFIGYRRDIYTAKLFRIQAQGSLILGDYPTKFAPIPLLGIRLTTK